MGGVLPNLGTESDTAAENGQWAAQRIVFVLHSGPHITATLVTHQVYRLL